MFKDTAEKIVKENRRSTAKCDGRRYGVRGQGISAVVADHWMRFQRFLSVQSLSQHAREWLCVLREFKVDQTVFFS